MADARRLLARMSASTQSLSVGFGSDPNALTQMDISLAAGRIKDKLTYRWVVYRYGGHESAEDIQRIEDMIILELSKWAVQERWRQRKGKSGLGKNKLRDVARLWIVEASHPHRCGYCKGSGKAFDRESRRHVSCTHCAGGGTIRWSNLQRAQWMQMRHSSWQQTWRGRYERLDQLMAAKEAHGLRIVSLALSD